MVWSHISTSALISWQFGFRVYIFYAKNTSMLISPSTSLSVSFSRKKMSYRNEKAIKLTRGKSGLYVGCVKFCFSQFLDFSLAVWGMYGLPLSHHKSIFLRFLTAGDLSTKMALTRLICSEYIFVIDILSFWNELKGYYPFIIPSDTQPEHCFFFKISVY